MRIRYTDEQKAQALESIQQIGVAKTSEAMGISLQTLYKWKSQSGTEETPATGKRRGRKSRETARALLAEADDTTARLAALQEENLRLRETNQKLRKALAALLDEE